MSLGQSSALEIQLQPTPLFVLLPSEALAVHQIYSVDVGLAVLDLSVPFTHPRAAFVRRQRDVVQTVRRVIMCVVAVMGSGSSVARPSTRRTPA